MLDGSLSFFTAFFFQIFSDNEILRTEEKTLPSLVLLEIVKFCLRLGFQRWPLFSKQLLSRKCTNKIFVVHAITISSYFENFSMLTRDG